MQKRSGFTLIELIVVIVLLAILAGVSVPNFLSWLPKYRLKSAARDLYSNLQLAKMSAIRANKDCRVKYYKNPDRYTVDLLNKTIRLSDYKSGITFCGPNNQTFAVATLTFNSRGTSNSGYAYLSNSGKTAYYRVGPLTSGAIKLQKYGGGTSWK
ncbi:MAG: prepilin-type N-terminal cleavage/methylation domain-containing protein [Deltaproteobacteria bacterium]|nr:prepilin-type N-terminal cleavage/methylation domain-containing protein [Deltaproteobacteria bacterium]